MPLMVVLYKFSVLNPWTIIIDCDCLCILYYSMQQKLLQFRSKLLFTIRIQVSYNHVDCWYAYDTINNLYSNFSVKFFIRLFQYCTSYYTRLQTIQPYTILHCVLINSVLYFSYIEYRLCSFFHWKYTVRTTEFLRYVLAAKRGTNRPLGKSWSHTNGSNRIY